MPPSRATAGTQPPLAEPADNEGFRIWIPVPVAALGALLTVAAGLLVLGPGVAGSILVLAFFVLLPGLAVVRLLGLHDAPLEVVLGIALSFAIAGLVSVIQAYFGGWSPTLTLGALVATTVAAVLAPLVASLVRERRSRSSVLGAPVAGSAVAWPSPANRSIGSPVSVGPRSAGAERRAATAPFGVVPTASFPPLGSLPGLVPPGVPATVAPPPTVMSTAPPATPVPTARAQEAPAQEAPAQEAPAAAAAAPVAPIDPTPTPRPSRARSRAASDLLPPPPVAIIRKRPKRAPGSPTAGTNFGSRPNRATLSAINQIVDDLADDRDETQS